MLSLRCRPLPHWLSECCEIRSACDEAGAAWQDMAAWLANASHNFDRMVGCHDPAALVVLARWAAVLVKRAEHVYAGS